MELKNNVQILTEALEFVSETYGVGNSPVSLGQYVTQEPTVYGELVSKLAEGIKEGEKADFIRFAENSGNHRASTLLSENSSSNLANFAILDTMMLREIWNRLGARDVMTYKVLETPLQYIPFFKQYVVQADGTKVDVPTALKSSTLEGRVFVREMDMDTEKQFNVFAKYPGGAIDNKYGKMTLDSFGEIVAITVDEGASTPSATDTNHQKIEQIWKADTEGNFIVEIKFFDKAHAGGGSGATTYTDTLMGKVNRLSGDVTFVSVKGHVKKVTYKVRISQETNKGVTDMVSFLEKEIVSVGDGETITSTISTQYLQDMKAVLKVDALAETSKLLSGTFAQVYDKQVYDEVAASISLSEQTIDFDASIMRSGNHIGISRQMHNADLLDRIIRSVGIIDSKYNFSSSVDFYLVCNPIENSIISSSIAPDYAGTVSQGGVVKPYTSGQLIAQSGKNDIRVISSANYEQGKMYLVPKPSADEEIVFGYFDYSQVLMPLGAYRSERNELLPTIAMNKRKTIKAFRPTATQCIKVTNSTKY